MREGTRVAFASERDGSQSNDIYVKRVDNSEPARLDPVRVVDREILLVVDFSYWDLHPDGDRFLIQVPAGNPTGDADDDGGGRQRYLVVLNWFNEMRGILEGR